MVGRAAEETGVEFGPSFERAPALNQLLVALRKLPDSVGAAAARIRGLERHQLGVFRSGRKVEQASDRF
jgi:hypothetical protein